MFKITQVLRGAGRGRQRINFALSHDQEYERAALHSFREGRDGGEIPGPQQYPGKSFAPLHFEINHR